MKKVYDKSNHCLRNFKALGKACDAQSVQKKDFLIILEFIGNLPWYVRNFHWPIYLQVIVNFHIKSEISYEAHVFLRK